MKPLYFSLLALCLYRPVFSQDNSPVIIGTKHVIHSQILKEDRPYWIYLPPSYHHKIFTNDRYPVMVLLDGNAHFHSTTGVVDFLSNSNKIPDMIVIGILNTDRTRDLTPSHTDIFNGQADPSLKNSGGGDRFLAFIDEELLPFIDSTYRTIPYRVLVGHSLGGLLTAHDFINEEPIFNAHLSIDPSMIWDNSIVVKHLTANSPFPRTKTGRIYIAEANNTKINNIALEFREAQEAFGQGLKKNELPDSCYKIEYFEKENHNTIPLTSTYQGLLFLFHNFPVDHVEEIELPQLKKHFEQISKQWQVPFIPFERNLNDLGYYHLYTSKNIKKAITFLIYNTELYPSSYNVWDSLAEAYIVDGDHKKAKLYYEKSLSINPNNKNAVKMLEKLK